jgi:hypothetical protein
VTPSNKSDDRPSHQCLPSRSGKTFTPQDANIIVASYHFVYCCTRGRRKLRRDPRRQVCYPRLFINNPTNSIEDFNLIFQPVNDLILVWCSYLYLWWVNWLAQRPAKTGISYTKVEGTICIPGYSLYVSLHIKFV